MRRLITNVKQRKKIRRKLCHNFDISGIVFDSIILTLFGWCMKLWTIYDMFSFVPYSCTLLSFDGKYSNFHWTNAEHSHSMSKRRDRIREKKKEKTMKNDWKAKTIQMSKNGQMRENKNIF